MQPHRFLRLCTWFVTMVFCASNGWAATITLADAPLVSGLAKTVAPNVLFSLDDSASMPEEYMPDNDKKGNALSSETNKACYRNFGYNTIYYNPYYTYDPPVKADGSSYLNSSFTGAWKDGYNTASGTQDLSPTPIYTLTPTTFTLGTISNPLATTNGSKTVKVTHSLSGLTNGMSVTFSGVTGSGSPPKIGGIPITNINGQSFNITVVDATHFTFSQGTSATATTSGGSNGAKITYNVSVHTGDTPNYYYYSYTANVAPYSATSPPSGDTAAANLGGCPPDSSYAKKDPTVDTALGRTPAQEKQNFANWYSYYRTRLLMMKTAAGHAFSGVTDKYRVGLTFTSKTDTAAANFLLVKKFDSTQRTAWYNMLYGLQNTFAGTPLRGALSKAGRYYAGTLAGALAGSDADPVQYSCQQNYTILATDGFWNLNGESGTYGAYQKDNTTLVGDQDSGTGAVRPYLDSVNSGTGAIIARVNTLADVAAYYYKTDLRPSAGNGGLTDESTHIDVSTNNVPSSNSDPAKYQHMTTFTMGLGVSDVLTYPTDLTNITQGTKNWPDPNVTNNGITVSGRVDDLWHAAVDGHGLYMSAKKPSDVEAQLTQALQTITATTGSSAAAATSNLQPVQGDNTAFIAQYKTVEWVGDLLARSIDVGTGAIATTNLWSAQAKLDAQRSTTTDSRTIYTYGAAYTNKVKNFLAGNLVAEITAGYFATSQLSQSSSWDATTQTPFATTLSLINYLRGQTSNEVGGSAATNLYRQRTHALGDIASAAPVYVRKAPFSYTDTGYASFIASMKTRVPTVYVGANDGMLHAFNGAAMVDDGSGNLALDPNGGQERWAYVPSMVVPNLYRLADTTYPDNHRFFVDGPIQVGDAYNSATSSWSTILVGGLGHGGRGYYALDVTDPANPKALWEFGTAQDNDIGYSYGNPIITKRSSDDRWVVVFASGYNNASPGDGKGRLYVLDAFTGAKLSEIITDNAVNDTDLSGIAKISNYVENGLVNNSTQWVYGGDLGGALWRFDITADCNPCTTGAQQRLGETSATAGTQPITVQPELAKIRDGAGNWHRVVYFGTGRYLGPNDVTSSEPSNSAAQAVYAVADTGADLGVLTTSAAALVSQTLDTSGDSADPPTPRKLASAQPVDWQTQNGWYVTAPAPASGTMAERFNVDPGLQLGVLAIASNVPEQGYCNPTGSSFLYQFDYKSGNLLKADSFLNAQIVGDTQLQLTSGQVVLDPVFGDGTTGNSSQVGGGGVAGGATRVTWREIQ